MNPDEVKKFIRFSEHNEWEGETWHFYVPKDHPKFEEAKKKAIEEGYSVGEKLFTPEEVETLVGNSDGGYMAYHNEVEDIDLEKGFYKGQAFKLVEYK